MDRAQALSTLDALWDADSEIGARLLVDVVSEMGYAAALTDAALIRLARAARDADAALERHRAGARRRLAGCAPRCAGGGSRRSS
jgi:hypothetical protein